MATTIPGTISGERMKEFSQRRPRIRPRTSANAAAVPRTGESTITTAPTHKLKRAASIHCGRPKKRSYHRKLKPGGGNCKNGEDENETGTITKIGKIRKTRTSAADVQTNRRAS